MTALRKVMPNQYTARWTKEEEGILKKHYTTLSKEEIMKLLPNRTWKAIIRKAHLLRCIGRPRNQKIRGYNAYKTINVNFFKQIGESQAYVFGRLITDGSWRLRKTGGEVRLKSIDKENLEKIRFITGSNHKIRKQKTKNGTWIHILDIYSNELVRDLQELEKRLEELIPNPHFLRGVVDGDGTISIYQGKELRVSIYSSNIEFLKAIQKVWGGTVYRHGEKNWMLEWRGEQAEKICMTIYGTNMPFLCIARKFSKWQLYQAMKGLLTVV
jgi:hypothetical protein